MLSEVIKIEKIYNSPVGALVVQACAELEASGHGWGMGAPGWDSNALYIADDGKPVAVLVWSVQDWKQEAHIGLGYVLPGYRGRGLYTQLWNALIEEAKTRKLRSIASGTHPDNKAMQAISEKQGRKVDSIGYRYELGA